MEVMGSCNGALMNNRLWEYNQAKELHEKALLIKDLLQKIFSLRRVEIYVRQQRALLAWPYSIAKAILRIKITS